MFENQISEFQENPHCLIAAMDSFHENFSPNQMQKSISFVDCASAGNSLNSLSSTSVMGLLQEFQDFVKSRNLEGRIYERVAGEWCLRRYRGIRPPMNNYLTLQRNPNAINAMKCMVFNLLQSGFDVTAAKIGNYDFLDALSKALRETEASAA